MILTTDGEDLLVFVGFRYVAEVRPVRFAIVFNVLD
jgi:hypothetical protein